MHRSNGGKIATAILVGGLLLTGALAGVSYGGANAIVNPTVIKLQAVPGGTERHYPLRDGQGHKSGSLDELRELVVDIDGDPVGAVFSQCFFARTVVWRCEVIAVLKDGPHTDKGTIHFSGIFRGFTGERFAVTGGTGAYDNVRGSATLTVENNKFIRTLYLIP
jgi:hypothetical protein